MEARFLPPPRTNASIGNVTNVLTFNELPKKAFRLHPFTAQQGQPRPGALGYPALIRGGEGRPWG